MMQAITLHRPWDYAMSDLALGDLLKLIENRSWKPTSVIGQRIALHAGLKYDYDGAEFIKKTLGVSTIPHRESGVIVATTLVVGWVAKGKNGQPTTANAPGLVEIAEASPWFFGPIGWVVAETRPLARPVACRGSQGLFPVPTDVERLIQLQEVA